MARYKDLDLDFTKHPATGDVSTKTDVEAVKRSVRNLVLTNRFERPFQPNKHSGIRQYLFEPLSPITAFAIRQKVIDVISKYEPRARVIEVQVVTDSDNNAFKVSIWFRTLSVPEPVQLNLLLKRLR